MPGGKCSWMMNPAVRVVNAFPRRAEKRPVPALEIAARDAGATVPSSPWPAVADAANRGARRRAGHYKHAEHIGFAIGNGNRHRAVQRRRGRNGLTDDRLHVADR